jgi:recombination protein RecR
VSNGPVDQLITLMAKLPGLGPRSARRAVLALIRRRERLLVPLAEALNAVVATVRTCETCGNVATEPRCDICRDNRRDPTLLCVVAEVADLWAIERAGVFRGRYHVLGGVLSALDGVTPASLRIPELEQRVRAEETGEVILALNATIDGQTTAHVIADTLLGTGARMTLLAQGVPVGGELDYLDEGTLTAAMSARRPL